MNSGCHHCYFHGFREHFTSNTACKLREAAGMPWEWLKRHRLAFEPQWGPYTLNQIQCYTMWGNKHARTSGRQLV